MFLTPVTRVTPPVPDARVRGARVPGGRRCRSLHGGSEAACTGVRVVGAAHGPHAERLPWACAVRLGVCLHGASYV